MRSRTLYAAVKAEAGVSMSGGGSRLVRGEAGEDEHSNGAGACGGQWGAEGGRQSALTVRAVELQYPWKRREGARGEAEGGSVSACASKLPHQLVRRASAQRAGGERGGGSGMHAHDDRRCTRTIWFSHASQASIWCTCSASPIGDTDSGFCAGAAPVRQRRPRERATALVNMLLRSAGQ